MTLPWNPLALAELEMIRMTYREKSERRGNPKRKAISVAAIQMSSGDNCHDNFNRAIELMTQAVLSDQASLLVLPENFLCFGFKGRDELLANMDRFIAELKSFAKQHAVSVIAGSIPNPTKPDGTTCESKLRSSSLAINGQGEIVARYDKMHLFDVDIADEQGSYRESEAFEAGDDLIVSILAGWNIGMAICYDLRFPELFQAQRVAGAEVISLPSAFTEVTGRAHWEVLVRVRAIETQCFVIAANQTGDHGGGRKTWGHSMIVDPWGKILAQCDDKAAYCVAEIDAQEQDKLRASLPVFNHKRLF